jgi:DNA invertase Pin-like site-specific DNA recombinase
MKPLRYIAYLRKSCESEEKQELSIPAQESEISKLASRLNLTIVGEPYKEAQSAKIPGRPLFSKMMDQIQKHKADGIVCWKLDRLARNPLDGGSIMWALGQGTINEIVTPDRRYTGTGDDKLLMSIIFGMATKYSDDLSDNIKRGNKQAMECGRWPGAPKLGYMRDRDTMQMIPDPERFPLVKEIWRLVLTGTAPLDVLWIANNKLGLRTPKRKRCGGQPLGNSRMYQLLHDPFYAGIMVHGSVTAPGAHQAMITLNDFERVQDIIRGKTRRQPRPKSIYFRYRGMIVCGTCGAMVTAQYATNRYGKRYTYYRCCRREKRYKFCPERCIDEREIERQVTLFLESLVLPPTWAAEVLKRLDQLEAPNRETVAAAKDRVRRIVDDNTRRMARLRRLLVDEVITADEYGAELRVLTLERERLEQDMARAEDPKFDVQPFVDGISFARQAVSAFQKGTPDEKREIVQALTSNLALKDRKVLIEAKKPFSLFRERPRFPNVCTWWEYVQTQLTGCRLP